LRLANRKCIKSSLVSIAAPFFKMTRSKQRSDAIAFLVPALAILISAGFSVRLAAAPRSDPAPAQIVFSVDPSHSKLAWTLDTTLHLVHGTFAVKRGEVTVDPNTGNATGEIVADATSGKTDNDSRDKKMHQEILETPKFPEIVFRVNQIEGLTAPPASKAQIKLHGTFSIHGTLHEMIVPADVEFTGDHWSGAAKFVVPYIAWGLKNPSNFLLKANPTVDVELELSGAQHLAAKTL
jgi:polyisoprenoid-binding protein YceI